MRVLPGFYQNRRWLIGLVLLALLIAGAKFRFAVVHDFHAPAGDGLQYYALSQQLLRAHRFAYYPPPLPLAYTRLPGYPLFLAFVAIRSAVSLVQHIVFATRANVVLDLGSALLVFLIGRSLTRLLGRKPAPEAAGQAGFFLRVFAPFFGLGFVLVSPLLLRMSCFALTESLATFLSTLALYLAVRAGLGKSRGARLGLGLLLGMALGAGQLVRADTLTLWPAILVLLLGIWRRSKPALGLLLVAGLGALAVFAPWPLRNLREFGHPYPFAWQWRTMQGVPLSTGPLSWARTWSSGAVGQAYIDVLFASSAPLDPNRPGVLTPAMYDSEDERLELLALFQRYDRERLSPGVDAAFLALAQKRQTRHPLRTYVVLPFWRLVHMWQPVAEYELPMHVSWLGLPARRGLWADSEYGLYALALLGLFSLVRLLPGRPLGAAIFVYLGTRSVLLCYTVPLGLTQRLLAPIMPALLLLSACGAASLLDRVSSWRR
jgi:hypothetical protein